MKIKRILTGSLALVVSLASLSGCAGDKKKDDDTVVSWYLSGVKQDSSYDEVFDKVNELMKKRYGLTLNVVLTDGSNYSQKVQMMNAARESYDLAFTCNWTNSYYTNVENGSLYDITEMLPKEAPKLYASLTDTEKKAVTIDDKIYAVPNWQVQARAMGFNFPKEVFDKSGMKIEDFKTLDDLIPYIETVQKIDPKLNKIGGGWQVLMTYYGLTTVVQEGLPGSIYYTEKGKPQIVNQFDTPEFMEFAKFQRNLVKKGLATDVYQQDSTSKKGVIRTPVSWCNWKPGQTIESSRQAEREVITNQVSPAVLSTESIISTLTGVGANSTHPEKALQVLEIMNNDKEIYNLMSFGIEGKNYEKTGENTIKLKENSTYAMSNWMMGSVMNSYLLDGSEEDLWNKTKEFNDTAIVSPIIGFSLDNSSISSDLGNCETVLKEQLDIIQWGLDDPEKTVPKLNSDLKVAGVDNIINEVQRQVDEWWAKEK